MQLDCTCFISAPNFTPTNLTVLHKNATSVTISWTAVNATDADGYVVYYNASNKVDIGNKREHTITSLQPNINYITMVRAYQDLLGPASGPLIIKTQASELNINKKIK